MRHHFGVGLAQEFGALLFQHVPQLAEILDDAIVNHRDVFSRMRMRIVFVWLAVGGPARVPDAGMARQRFGLQSQFKISQFAFGAAALEMVAFQRGDASGIIAAIFEALERIHNLVRDRTAPKNADNAAHANQCLQINQKNSNQREVHGAKLKT